jgi:dihydrofolate synthase / folylpolyglutamate synthase
MKPFENYTYDETEEFFESFSDFSKARSAEAFETVAKDIAEFRKALGTLGDPHLDYSTIHVAGSKGKGSTCAFLASVLQHAGLRTGLHVTPHAFSRTECMAVNGEEISERDFVRLVAKLRRILSDGPDKPHKNPVLRALRGAGMWKPPRQFRAFKNYLAYETGAALLYLAEKKVDIGVIETGMGGRLDHTNVFDKPPHNPEHSLTCLVTTMAMEHRIPLGDTIRKITDHKTGIIQPHALSVLGFQMPEFYADVLASAQARIAATKVRPILDVNQSIFVVPGSDKISDRGSHATYRSDSSKLNDWFKAINCADKGEAAELAAALEQGLQMQIPLAGRHQIENQRGIIGSALALGAHGIKISPKTLANGIAATKWPYRFDIVSEDPLMIADASHEPLSITAFARTYRQLYGDRPVIAVTTFLKDNDFEAMCKAASILPLKHLVCLTPKNNARRIEPEESIRRATPILGIPMTPAGDAEDAITKAMALQRDDDAILVYAASFKAAGLLKRDVAKWQAIAHKNREKP